MTRASYLLLVLGFLCAAPLCARKGQSVSLAPLLSHQNAEAELVAFIKNKPCVIVLFTARNCYWSKKLATELESAKARLSSDNVSLVRLDVLQSPELHSRLSLTSLPELQVFRDAKRVGSWEASKILGQLENTLRRQLRPFRRLASRADFDDFLAAPFSVVAFSRDTTQLQVVELSAQQDQSMLQWGLVDDAALAESLEMQQDVLAVFERRSLMAARSLAGFADGVLVSEFVREAIVPLVIDLTMTGWERSYFHPKRGLVLRSRPIVLIFCAELRPMAEIIDIALELRQRMSFYRSDPTVDHTLAEYYSISADDALPVVVWRDSHSSESYKLHGILDAARQFNSTALAECLSQARPFFCTANTATNLNG